MQNYSAETNKKPRPWWNPTINEGAVTSMFVGACLLVGKSGITESGGLIFSAFLFLLYDTFFKRQFRIKQWIAWVILLLLLIGKGILTNIGVL